MSNTSKILNIKKSSLVDQTQVASKGITYKTIGTTLQALAVQLDANEKIYSEIGKMSWMTDNIKLNTRSQGFAKMISRIFARESLFINEFTCTAGTGIVTFSTDQAGKIIPIDLVVNKAGVIFQKGSYLCSEHHVNRTTVILKKLTAGLFGGKGFIMQKLTGQGRAHLISDGEVVMYELGQDDTMMVDQGNLIAYEETVDFDIKTVDGGVKNWLFGGEGLFLGVLKGPGKIWMQTRKHRLVGNMPVNSQIGRTPAAKNPLGCLISMIISLGFFVLIIALTVITELG